MNDTSVGRLLVASLHQSIADLLPTRLEFYEAWLTPVGQREGRTGVAPLAAALSFLRLEGAPYQLVATRAGEYTAEWTVTDLSQLRRHIITSLPPAIRKRLVVGVARQMVRRTSDTTRVGVRWRRGHGVVELRHSLFCDVRTRADHPLCEFYAAAFRRLLSLFSLDARVVIEQCHATGADPCALSVTLEAPLDGRRDEAVGA